MLDFFVLLEFPWALSRALPWMHLGWARGDVRKR